jgi:hypothetical protein
MYCCFRAFEIILIVRAVVALAVLPVATPRADLIKSWVCSDASFENFIAISFPATPPSYPIPPPIAPAKVPRSIAFPISLPDSSYPVRALLVTDESPPAAAPPTAEAPI